MTSSRQLIIYIHGFNSSPASEKARQFSGYCRRLDGFHNDVNNDSSKDSSKDSNKDIEIAIPALSHDPEAAIRQLEQLAGDAGDNLYLLVGSSLGGYYATWLAEKYDCRAVLVNPAVSPVKNLGEEFLGPQKNLYTGEEYEFTREHAMFLDTLDVQSPGHPGNFLLLVQSGDEVLDYRLAVERYAGAVQVVQEGGSHRFEHFEDMIPAMLEFAENGRLSKERLAAISSRIKSSNT